MGLATEHGFLVPEFIEAERRDQIEERKTEPPAEAAERVKALPRLPRDLALYHNTDRSMLAIAGLPASIIASSSSWRRISTTRATPSAPARPSPHR